MVQVLCGEFNLLGEAHLGHLLGDLLAGPHGLDEGPGGHQGPLDGGGKLPGDVSERPEAVNVIRETGEVETVEVVLSIQNLQMCLVRDWS